jgi:hypothetical protein
MYMKKLLFLSTAFLLLSSAFATTAPFIRPTLNASEIYLPLGNNGQKVSLLDLSRMKIREAEVIRGAKMKFADRIIFKAAQNKLRNLIRPDGKIDSKIMQKHAKKYFAGSTGFHLGGFALGFLLGIIGVLIAYLIKDEYKSNRVKWAWIGFAIQAVIGLISLLA